MIRKWITGALCLALLCGCSGKEAQPDSASVRYQVLYEELLQRTSFEESPEHYSLSLEMTGLPDETYRYYVVIDSPQTPMYEVTALVVENNTSFKDSDKMMPSAGIFDSPGSLVPGKIDREEGYVKGIALSGECSTDSVDLRILVEWQDADRNECTNAFHVLLTPSGVKQVKGENVQ